MQRPRILVVDDDISTVELLKSIFECEGYEVFTAYDPDEAVKAATTHYPDLIVLDLMMPHKDGSDGVSVCRTLRENDNPVPIIILSGIDDLKEQIKLLNTGADDYLTKPFDIDELKAHINSVLRRSKGNTSLVHSFSSKDVFVDFDAQRVTFRDEEVRLSYIEYRLLEELARNAGHVLSYKHLLDRVWDPTYENNKEYLHVYVNYLRKKLEADPKNPKCIINVPGRGYRFDKE